MFYLGACTLFVAGSTSIKLYDHAHIIVFCTSEDTEKRRKKPNRLGNYLPKWLVPTGFSEKLSKPNLTTSGTVQAF